ncbi:hypothetical protein [Archaeoglobus neptunius]|uniref:hypothetical protein n=1 Tax=Archaeoglobus neptunius TaxID=2798580 RepID=UPI0019287F56|nr:hypothetical protein [Archaeoglobus neptunius]
MQAEYAYIVDGKVRGNSRIAGLYLMAVKEFVEKCDLEELAFSTDEYSAVLVRKPVLLFVKVGGDISEAKVQLRKILRKEGFIRNDSLEDAFRLAEEIESLPIEEVLRRVKR